MSKHKHETPAPAPAPPAPPAAAKADAKLSDREAKRVLELAFSSGKDTGALSLDELAASAAELGVPREKIDEAYKLMRAHQADARVRNKRLAIAGTALCLVVGAIALMNQAAERARIAEENAQKQAAIDAATPHPFKGTVTLRFTSAVADGAAVDTLERVRVLETRKMVLATSYSGLDHTHRTRMELRGPDGALIDEQVVQMTDIGEPYLVWYNIPVSWHWKPGTYTATVWADDTQVGTKTLEVELGVTKVVTAGKVDDSKPTDLRDHFSKAKDKDAWAHIHFDYVKGDGGRLRWTWTSPDGKPYETESLEMGDQNGVWNAWDSIGLTNAPTGKWHVVISLEDSPLGEADFTVE